MDPQGEAHEMSQEEIRLEDNKGELDKGNAEGDPETDTAFVVGYIEGMVSAAGIVANTRRKEDAFLALCERAFTMQMTNKGAATHYANNADLMPIDGIAKLVEPDAVGLGLIRLAFDNVVNAMKKED